MLIIREVKIKTTVRYHLTLVIMAIIKKFTNGNSLAVQWLGLCAFTDEDCWFDPWSGN